MYFDVSEQSHVSVRIEEAFQRYTPKKADTRATKTAAKGSRSCDRGMNENEADEQGP